MAIKFGMAEGSPGEAEKMQKRGACPLLDRLPEKLKVRGLSNNE